MNFAQKAVAQHIQNTYPTVFSSDLSGLVADIPSHTDPTFTSLDDYIQAKERLVKKTLESRIERLGDDIVHIEDKIFELEEEADKKRAQIESLKAALGNDDEE